MKYNLLILAIISNLLIAFTTSAQEKSTLVQGNNSPVQRNMNLFGEAGIKIMTVSGDAMPALNVNLGIGFNQNISAGLGFQTTISNFQPDVELDPEVFYNMYFGSLFFEYNWNPNNVFSISTPLHIGAGINKLINNTGEDISGLESDKIIVIMPSLKGNINVSPRVSLNLNAGYRLIGLTYESRGLGNGNLSGLEAGIGFRYNIL